MQRRTDDNKTHGPLLLGGTGRVARALVATWPQDAPAPLAQGRTAPAPYLWDMDGPPPPLPARASGIVSLAGAADTDAATQARLARAARDLAAREGLRLLVASSQAVYGRPAAPARETDAPAPDTAYGHAKARMEDAVMGAPGVTLLRIGNVAGCDGLLTAAARTPRPALDEVAQGKGPLRSWIGPVTLGHVIRALLAAPGPLPPVLNVALPGPLRMEALLAAAGVPWDWRAPGPACLPELTLDTGALRRLVPLPDATPAGIVAEARAGGWRAA